MRMDREDKMIVSITIFNETMFEGLGIGLPNPEHQNTANLLHISNQTLQKPSNLKYNR